MAMAASLLLAMTLAACCLSTTTAHAAATSDGSLVKACKATKYEDTCIAILKPIIPDGATASPKQLAAVALRYLLREGPAVLSANPARGGNGTKQERHDLKGCLAVVKREIRVYNASLAQLSSPAAEKKKKITDATLVEAHRVLKQVIIPNSHCGRAAGLRVFPVLGRMYAYEAMLQVTLDLIDQAGLPGTAPPPLSGSPRLASLCNATVYARTCVATLAPIPGAAAAAATPRGLAKLAVVYLVNGGAELDAEVRAADREAFDFHGGSEDEKQEVRECLNAVGGEMGDDVDRLRKLAADLAGAGGGSAGKVIDETLVEVRGILRDKFRLPSTSIEVMCRPYSRRLFAVVNKVVAYRKMLKVTLDLINMADLPTTSS